jgi:lysophospholipase L1-like esterase
VANHAESGETLRGSLNELRLAKVLDSLHPGDYVFLQFGTNDSKSSGAQNIYPNQDFSETYAPADTLYKELLKQYVAEIKKRAAYPVIISPPARRGETVGSRISLGAYATAAMEAAKDVGVPFINLNLMGQEMNTALGAAAAQIYADQTHTQDYGAYMFSRCVALGIKEDNLALAKYLADDTLPFDPKAPMPTPDNFKVPSGAASARGAGGGGGRGGRGGRAGAAAPAETPDMPVAQPAVPAANP